MPTYQPDVSIAPSDTLQKKPCLLENTSWGTHGTSTVFFEPMRLGNSRDYKFDLLKFLPRTMDLGLIGLRRLLMKLCPPSVPTEGFWEFFILPDFQQ
jgi:hypothetical protein